MRRVAAGAARERHRAFVSQGVGKSSPWDDLRGQVLVGPDDTVERLSRAFCDKSEIVEVPKQQHLTYRLSLANLLPRPTGGGGKAGRDRAIREAVLDRRYTLAEIARHVGLHHATNNKVASCACPHGTRGNQQGEPSVASTTSTNASATVG